MKKQTPKPKPKPKPRPPKFDAAEWQAYHAAPPMRRMALDKHPAAAQLLTEMLGAIEGPVMWKRVSKYIRQAYPDAPIHFQSYQHWAEARLGESR